MIASEEINSNRPYWFINVTDDKRFESFIKKGIWELLDGDAERSMMSKYLDHLSLMKPGDNIAIKQYGKSLKSELNFPISEDSVWTVYIASVGAITSIEDRKVRVEWKHIFEPKEKKWYFFRHHDIISRFYQNSSDWRKGAFIGFAFYNVEQDIERFLKDSR